MMQLEKQQRALLALMKNRPADVEGDDYLLRVAGSETLGLLREIAVWWRALGIERNCPHTTILLRRLGRFDEAVEAFYCDRTTSPYMEEMAAQFLEIIAADPDVLLAAVARFEWAVLRVALGDEREFSVEWDRDPGAVFEALRTDAPLPEPRGRHQVSIAWRCS